MIWLMWAFKVLLQQLPKKEKNEPKYFGERIQKVRLLKKKKGGFSGINGGGYKTKR